MCPWLLAPFCWLWLMFSCCQMPKSCAILPTNFIVLCLLRWIKSCYSDRSSLVHSTGWGCERVLVVDACDTCILTHFKKVAVWRGNRIVKACFPIAEMIGLKYLRSESLSEYPSWRSMVVLQLLYTCLLHSVVCEMFAGMKLDVERDRFLQIA